MIESFEQYVNKVLNISHVYAGMAAQVSLTESNSVKAMVTAGSKGSFIKNDDPTSKTMFTAEGITYDTFEHVE
jgi:DNA-directed RNA polymerase II subunit RPB1